ncbi:bifunctional preprotein translocase subunit SecD/SecF [Alcanivorax balearicus MACL04]|uniref:Multifunctional fusion protein n=1 Tax=Alloalcanivorax balearicus MACL04 TaxID=1177182 RepID=A0ABT2QZQ5_9GAMM|nr:protein translocase subunit SecD [Alloalcanivorax balearicus]MCU5782982.1 bifunctional preprotein translocase subunit SecD/SecF [Alloalcanivorax balearicus MACL04]
MNRFRLRATAYAVVILLGVLAALPSILPPASLQRAPDWYRQHHLSLGLDLQGGSHVLLKVEQGPLLAEKTRKIAQELGQRLDRNGIQHGRPVVDGDQVRLAVRPASAMEAALRLASDVRDNQGRRQLSVTHDGPSLVLRPSSSLSQQVISDAVERSLDVVRRRIDETGVVEPRVTRQGDDAILVQLPGVTDPERITALLGRTARLTFHLVADGSSPDRSLMLPGVEDGRRYQVEATPLLDGGQLADARLGFDSRTHQPVVNFTLDSDGARLFGDITTHNVGRPFAVVLDGEVITAPVIRTPITAGRGEISGNFTPQQAGDLAMLLRAGSLPAPLQVVEQRTVGAELGGDTIRMGVLSGALGAALVLVFMISIYRRWGVIANTALAINVLLVLGLLASFGATLTLPGIAGLILGVGMAVDANILINERIREEAEKGKNAMAALRAGFQRAFATIVDANITTLIAVGLLFGFGSGPVRGFAVTMAVGLLVSMFTSVSVTRLLMEWRLRRRQRQPLVLPEVPGFQRLRQRQRPIQFMRVKALGIVLSVLLSVLSLGSLAWPGLNQGIDFLGGTAMEVQVPASLSENALRQALRDAGLTDAALQPFADDGHFLVRMPASEDGNAAVETAKTAITSLHADSRFPRVDMVGPAVSGGFVEASILAVLLAGAGMFAYLRLRFERHFAWAALITLLLDVSKTLGFFVLTGVEFNLTAIAALLTLIGYSVNDKVVVFDRIRENQKLNPDQPLETLINVSLTQVLTRTLFTSATTFLALLPMGLLGGGAVASFALPVLFGIVVGTTSSMYIAAPMALFLARWRPTPRADTEALAERP